MRTILSEEELAEAGVRLAANPEALEQTRSEQVTQAQAVATAEAGLQRAQALFESGQVGLQDLEAALTQAQGEHAVLHEQGLKEAILNPCADYDAIAERPQRLRQRIAFLAEAVDHGKRVLQPAAFLDLLQARSELADQQVDLTAFDAEIAAGERHIAAAALIQVDGIASFSGGRAFEAVLSHWAAIERAGAARAELEAEQERQGTNR